MIRNLVERNRTYRRFYENETISKEQLMDWVDLARITSSGMNMQPLKYILSCEPKKTTLSSPI
jgi:nitroreductase